MHVVKVAGKQSFNQDPQQLSLGCHFNSHTWLYKERNQDSGSHHLEFGGAASRTQWLKKQKTEKRVSKCETADPRHTDVLA